MGMSRQAILPSIKSSVQICFSSSPSCQCATIWLWGTDIIIRRLRAAIQSLAVSKSIPWFPSAALTTNPILCAEPHRWKMAAPVTYDAAGSGGTLFEGRKFWVAQRVPTRSRWLELITVRVSKWLILLYT